MAKLKWFFKTSKIFIVSSYYFIRPFKLRDYLHYPKAYLKFMKLCYGDFKEKDKK